MSVVYSVEIDYDDDGSFATAGDTVTGSIVQLFWRLGMARPYDLVAADGRAEVTLSNTAQAYSPEHVTKLLPGKPIRIRTDDGVMVRTQWTGFIHHVSPSAGITNRLAKITAYDTMPQIAQNFVQIGVQVNKTVDSILDTLLKACRLRYATLTPYMIIGVTGYDIIGTGRLFGIPAVTESFETGKSTIAQIGDAWKNDTQADQIVDELLQIERGRFFFDRTNTATFYHRHHTILDLAVDASFSTNMRGITYDYAREMVNRVWGQFRPRSAGSAGSVLWSSGLALGCNAGEIRVLTVRFRDSDQQPIGASTVIAPVSGTDFTCNTAADGSGTVATSSGEMVISSVSSGGSVTLEFRNHGSGTIYFRGLQVRGTPLNQNDVIQVEAINRTNATLYDLRSLEFRLPSVYTFEDADNLMRYELGRRYAPLGVIEVLRLSRQTYETQVLARTLFDRITVADAQLAHSADYFIVAEEHEMTAGGATHEAFYLLEKCDSDVFFRVGDIIGGGRTLAF